MHGHSLISTSPHFVPIPRGPIFVGLQSAALERQAGTAVTAVTLSSRLAPGAPMAYRNPRQLPHSQHLISHRRCQQKRASDYPSTLPSVIAGYRHCNQTLSPSAQISQPHLPYWPSLPRATPCVVDVASSLSRPALLPAASHALRTALQRVVPDLRQHAVRRVGSSLSPSLSMHSIAFARAPRDSEVPSYLASCIRPSLATGPAHPVRGVLLQIDTSDSEAIGYRSTGTSACRKRISRPSLRRSFVHHQPNQESVQSFGARLDDIDVCESLVASDVRHLV